MFIGRDDDNQNAQRVSKSMMRLFYTSINGTLSGRASYGFSSDKSAETCRDAQNNRAENLGIKARYEVCQCDREEIPEKEVRE